MSNRVLFGGTTINIPHGWFDVTEDLSEGSPNTLARSDGLGALQFSIAKYRSGTRPKIQIHDLRELLEEFGAKHCLGAPVAVEDGYGKNSFVTGYFLTEGCFVRAWYVTNGCDLVLVTYVTQEFQSQQAGKELDEAATIIASLDFQ